MVSSQIWRLNFLVEGDKGTFKASQQEVTKLKTSKDNLANLYNEVDQQLTSKDLELVQCYCCIATLSSKLDQMKEEKVGLKSDLEEAKAGVKW